MSENSSYLCEKLVIQAIIPTHKTCCCMSPNRRKIILTDLQFLKFTVLLLTDTHKYTAHNAITFYARGTTCNWYHLLLLVCLCVCACVRVRTVSVLIGRKWSWECWLCLWIGTEWHEKNGGGWIFEGWGLLLWSPGADWKTCFDMWLLTPVIQLDLTALHSQTPTVFFNLS